MALTASQITARIPHQSQKWDARFGHPILIYFQSPSGYFPSAVISAMAAATRGRSAA